MNGWLVVDLAADADVGQQELGRVGRHRLERERASSQTPLTSKPKVAMSLSRAEATIASSSTMYTRGLRCPVATSPC